MKHARPFFAAIAFTLVCTAATASACDQEKSSAAAAAARTSKKGVTAVTADVSGKACTAEQMAACKAHGASAATASAGHAGCASKSATSAGTAGSSSSCGAKGAGVNARAAGSGSSCSGHGMAKAAGKSAHADCDACVDMSACGEELSAAGAHTHVVPLKNGVMFVYTADSPSQITAVQSAMARRGERMAQFATAGEKARLCAECKSLRNAMASGKLNREVVNIEGGALTLMTSDDPAVVAKIHAMVDTRSYARTKS